MRFYTAVLRMVTLCALLLGALTLMATHQAPQGGWVGNDPAQAAAVREARGVNVPQWEDRYAVRFPGCAAELSGGQVPSAVLAVRLSGTLERVPFDQAHTLNTNDAKGDDVWVVGGCA